MLDQNDDRGLDAGHSTAPRNPQTGGLSISMESPRTYPETARRIGQGLVLGFVASTFAVMLSGVYWALAALTGTPVAPILGATIGIAFVTTMLIVDVVYHLNISHPNGRLRSSDYDAILERFVPGVQAFAVSMVYVNMLVLLGILAASFIGQAYFAVGLLVAVGDLWALRTFKESPAGFITEGAFALMNKAGGMPISLDAFPLLLLEDATD